MVQRKKLKKVVDEKKSYQVAVHLKGEMINYIVDESRITGKGRSWIIEQAMELYRGKNSALVKSVEEEIEKQEVAQEEEAPKETVEENNDKELSQEDVEETETDEDDDSDLDDENHGEDDSL